MYLYHIKTSPKSLSSSLLTDSMEDFLNYNMSALNVFNILFEETNSLQHLSEDKSSALILMIAFNRDN